MAAAVPVLFAAATRRAAGAGAYARVDDGGCEGMTTRRRRRCLAVPGINTMAGAGAVRLRPSANGKGN
uniref:Uncharacterized protein n=1 Tax=Leersia perrieri TaxID=77586 RepID=A0A0D9WZD4_9ORYZ